MKRRFLYTIVLILTLVLGLAPSTLAKNNGGDELFPIEIKNRSDQPVNLVLLGTERSGIYSLTIPANTTKKFTLLEDVYNHTTYACGDSATGKLDVSRQLLLVFTQCIGSAPNSGEPSMEKVHLSDAPKGKEWFYQYVKAVPPVLPLSQNGGFPGACELTTSDVTTIYSRPSTTANVFATVGPDTNIQFGAQTQNGWLGFDPGVAQAANIGSFRLRWIAPGTGTVVGDCGNLPVVWGPPPSVCFDMPLGNTNVYTDPDFNSTVLAVLHVGEFAEILGRTADGNWAKVDLKPGNTQLNITGWVGSGTLNMNGPCSNLPTVNP